MDLATALQSGQGPGGQAPQMDAQRQQFIEMYGVDPATLSQQEVMELINTPPSPVAIPELGPDRDNELTPYTERSSVDEIPPNPGELSTLTSPVGDQVAEQFGTEYGVPATKIHGMADQLTGNPFVEGGGDAGERLTTLAAPLGVGPALRGGKAALSAGAPALSKALIGGSAMGLTAANAGDEAADDPIQSLYAERARLVQQRDAALRDREKEAQTGRGPNYESADQIYQDLSAKVTGLESMIQAEQAKNSPEAQLELQTKQDEITRQQGLQATQDEEERKRRELDQPFAERHPNIAQGLAVGAPIAALGLGRYGVGKIAKRGASYLDDFNAARQSGDTVSMAEELAKLNRWQRRAPAQKAATIGAAGSIPVEARALPDVIDAMALPEGSKARRAARERFSDPMEYAKDSLPAIAQGMASAWAGSKLGPQPAAYRSDAIALRDVYGAKQTAPTLSKQLQEGAVASQALQGGARSTAPTIRYERFSNGQARHRDLSTGRLTKSPESP